MPKLSIPKAWWGWLWGNQRRGYVDILSLNERLHLQRLSSKECRGGFLLWKARDIGRVVESCEKVAWGSEQSSVQALG